MPLNLEGSTSGATTLQSSATATGTLTLPAATDTLVGMNTTDTLTNKTISDTLNLTGGQIKFPATQVPSADVNTLDDYEEGTWVPVFTGFSTPPTVSSATYTKIGRVVTAKLKCVGAPVSNTTGFTVTLPFTCGVTEQGQLSQGQDNGIGNIVIAYINSGDNYTTLYYGATAANWTASGYKSVSFTLTYFV